MRILIFGKRRPKLPRALNGWAGQILVALVPVRIDLLNRVHDQRTAGGAGLLRPSSQPVVKWLRNVNRSTNCHDIIMSHSTGGRQLSLFWLPFFVSGWPLQR